MRTLKKIVLMPFFIVFALAFLQASYAANAQAIGTKIDDSTITAKIYLKYTKDAELNPFKLDVSTQHGIVTVKGTVDTSAQYKHAVTLATSTEGVKDLNADHLKIKSSDQPVADLLITAKINGKLLQQKLFHHNTIEITALTIETKNGVVFVSGHVANNKEKEALLTLIHSIDGVKSINSSYLTIKNQ